MKSYENKPDEIEISTEASPKDAQSSEEELSASPIDQEVATSERVQLDVSSEEITEAPEDTHPIEPESRSWWQFSPPTRAQFWTAVAFGGIILLAAILRFWALGAKPLHHDESLHAYFSRNLLLKNIEAWASCFNPNAGCYRYDPLLHGPFQFHIIALIYKIAEFLGVPDHGANDVTVRIAAATLGTALVGLPYFLRHQLGKLGAWLACFLLAVSPGMVYYSRFAREDIYMAFFTLLMVVAAAQYVRTRKMAWFIVGVLGFVLAYATKEATFLTIAVFGSFFGVLLLWDLSVNRRLPLFSKTSPAVSVRPLPALTISGQDSAVDEVRIAEGSTSRETADGELSPDVPAHDEVDAAENKEPASTGGRRLPATPVVLLTYLAILAVLAKLFFDWLKYLGGRIKADPAGADAFVAQLKQTTIMVIPLLGILLAVVVIGLLLAEQFGLIGGEERNSLARKVNPRRQPLLDTIVTMPWTHWFFGFVLGWTLFLLLFTALFTNIPGGIADGIWQGIYYWLQQQDVQRGGQPWYYYLMLIPLYEQIGVVFGIVGIVRSLLRPTRFRLFLIWWFVGSFFIYSWAGEKMPWLMIHITLPLLLLAAIGLQPAVSGVYELVKEPVKKLLRPAPREESQPANGNIIMPLPPSQPRGRIANISACLGVFVAVCTLIVTLQNMVQVTYVHPAAAQNEMMIYVQTTPSVPATMQKIEELDQKYYGGKRQIPVGVMEGTGWPWIWYLRDYTNVCLNYQLGAACPGNGSLPPVIIADAEHMELAHAQYASTYFYHVYEMRAQWNQGYMPPPPPPCTPAPGKSCPEVPAYTGVGPLSWLSYGNTPPRPGAVDVGRIIQNVWQWWWTRQPFGGYDTGYQMGILFRKDLGVQP